MNQKSSSIKVVLRPAGGLGNQLFQLSAGLRFVKAWGGNLMLDTSLLGSTESDIDEVRYFELENLFEMDFPRASPWDIRKLYPATNGFVERLLSRVSREVSPGDLRVNWSGDDVDLSPPTSSVVGIVGRYQSNELVESVIERLPSGREFKPKLNSSGLELAKEIESNALAVAIHVRRGDYVNHPLYREKLGFVGEKYLERAMERIALELNANPKFYVFTNDSDWCRGFFNTDVSIVNESFCAEHAHSDFILMTKFRNHIISNSTFSWWAARLSAHESPNVIMPTPWALCDSFESNLVVKGWIRVPR